MTVGSWSRWRAQFARIVRGVARRLNRAAETAAPTMPELPGWAREELFALASIEPELVTPEGGTDKYAYYHVPNVPGPGRAYAEVLQKIPEADYTHVVLLPWLKQGGADRGALYHVRALMEQASPARVLVLSTEPAGSPWASRLPANVPFVEFGLLARGLDFHMQVQVLVRLLVQLRPPIIHVINSRCGWEAIRQCGLALRQHTLLFASLFCDEYNDRGIPVGYARDYLRACHDDLTRVYCDNTVYPRIWEAELGIPPHLFHVLPFPYDREIVKRSGSENPASPRVLWAGRLDKQKRLDILAAIARRMPDVTFDVHGGAVVSAEDGSVSELRRLENVVMHGLFSRLEDVVRPDHVAYLHTTAWEGLPTILFDVAAAGVPICAPDIGGISDFVDARWIIADSEDVEKFVCQLNKLATSREERDLRREAQYQVLATQRAWPRFVEQLAKQSPYLDPWSDRPPIRPNAERVAK